MTNRNLYRLLDELVEVKAEKDKAAKEYDKLKEELLKELDRRGVDNIDNGKHTATRSEYKSNRLDTKRIKAEFPEVYDEFNTVTVSVRLTLK